MLKVDYLTEYLECCLLKYDFSFSQQKFCSQFNPGKTFFKILYTSSHITTILFFSSIFTRKGIFKINSQQNLLRAEVTQGMD